MEIYLIKALQVVLALTFLVFVHELGHYLLARIFGIKVNRFYLFFNPSFSVLKYDPLKGTLKFIARQDKKTGEEVATKTWQVNRPREEGENPTWRSTVYGIGWLPLGGYCDIAGMIDETKKSDQLQDEPQPWEFRSKSRPKRLCVMAAGAVFNFLCAFAVYTGIAAYKGENFVPFNAMTEGLDFAPEMIATGFQNGDMILSVNGKAIDTRKMSSMMELISAGSKVTVKRGNDTALVVISDTLMATLAAHGPEYTPMAIRFPIYVDRTSDFGPAGKAGIKAGDRIIRVGRDTTPTLAELNIALRNNKGSHTQVLVLRGKEKLSIPLKIDKDGMLGIIMLHPSNIFKTTHVHYNLFEAIPRGIEIAVDKLSGYVASLKVLATPTGVKQVGGFGTVATMFPDSWNWYGFWHTVAFLSIILGFMNLLPIPALDGGHIFFLLIEMVIRRPINEKVVERANMAGLTFLIILMFLANANDLLRVFS